MTDSPDFGRRTDGSLETAQPSPLPDSPRTEFDAILPAMVAKLLDGFEPGITQLLALDKGAAQTKQVLAQAGKAAVGARAAHTALWRSFAEAFRICPASGLVADFLLHITARECEELIRRHATAPRHVAQIARLDTMARNLTRLARIAELAAEIEAPP